MGFRFDWGFLKILESVQDDCKICRLYLIVPLQPRSTGPCYWRRSLTFSTIVWIICIGWTGVTPGNSQWAGQEENPERDLVPTVVIFLMQVPATYNFCRSNRQPYMQRHDRERRWRHTVRHTYCGEFSGTGLRES